MTGKLACIKVFGKNYTDEDLYDLGRDMEEAIDPTYNETYMNLPRDEDGFCKGTFHVAIIWHADKDGS